MCATALALFGPTAAGAAERTPTVKRVLEDAKKSKFRIYWAGDRVLGDPITDAFVRTEPRTQTPTFTFIYGDCDGDACAPIEVQVYAACARNLAIYERAPKARRLHFHRTRIRRVPAITVREETGAARIEIYTGRSTIVIFATSGRRARRIAKRLASIDGRIQPRERFPRPAVGHLAGKVECS